MGSHNLNDCRASATALEVGVGGGCLDIFTLIYLFSPLSPSFRETARYILKYCLRGPLNPKQPINQAIHLICVDISVGQSEDLRGFSDLVPIFKVTL